MRTNVFCIIIAIICAVAAGAVTQQYHELQDTCQVATQQSDTMHSAASDMEIAFDKAFSHVDEVLFMDAGAVELTPDSCEDLVHLLGDSIAGAFDAQSFEQALLNEVDTGIITLFGDTEDLGSLEEETWLDEEEDAWMDNDWPADDEDWLNDDLDEEETWDEDLGE